MHKSSQTSSSTSLVKHLLCTECFAIRIYRLQWFYFPQGMNKNFLTRERFNNAHFTIEIVFRMINRFLQT
jgi:hypothetical protein